MKNKILMILCAGLVAFSANLAVLTPAVNAATTPTNCEANFFGFRAWYDGLPMDENCNITGPEVEDAEHSSDVKGKKIASFVWRIVLNVLSSLFSLTAMVAMGFVIYGGFLQIMSRGEYGRVVQGKKTIGYALLGMGLAIFATIIVNTLIVILTNQWGA